jgi:hypothetical protein
MRIIIFVFASFFFCMDEEKVTGLFLARVPRVSQVILAALKQLN